MKIDKEVKRLVIARLDAMPNSMKISIGNEGTLNKEELIKHVNRGDELGRMIIEIHMNHLRSYKKNS